MRKAVALPFVDGPPTISLIRIVKKPSFVATWKPKFFNTGRG
jgi:hypothetical protein